MKAEDLVKNEKYWHPDFYFPLTYKGNNQSKFFFDSKVALIMLVKNQVKRLMKKQKEL
jgi:hypothetical protein